MYYAKVRCADTFKNRLLPLSCLCAEQGEVKRQNKEWISELQVQIDRPKTLLQDKRQELQRKLAVLKLEVCILRTKVKTQKLERQRTAPAAFSTHGHSPPLMSPQRAAPSGGRGSAEGGGPVVGIQQAITPREQKVTTLEQDLEAAQSQTTERKQQGSKVMDYCIGQRWISAAAYAGPQVQGRGFVFSQTALVSTRCSPLSTSWSWNEGLEAPQIEVRTLKAELDEKRIEEEDIQVCT
ncbi:hypothetical protein PFLUV_G00032390 [Perca fluviatilis]|uniref:Uncharacterized protein n=1 Tax=Perca fluviatilis TaxID=8168 RepID=A0A6A5ETG6_PERFL|nr:hypothetical protein PFLUV_G00032390 [Perca fluviatilis]